MAVGTQAFQRPYSSVKLQRAILAVLAVILSAAKNLCVGGRETV